MVVQHFSPVGFSRRKDWTRQAHEIMDKLKLDNKKFSEFKLTNPPIVPGEVYIGTKSQKLFPSKNNKFKLFYIPPKLIFEPENQFVWSVFVPILSNLPSPYKKKEGIRWKISPTAHTTRMSIRGDDFRDNWIADNTSYIKEKIEKSYPQYISLTELKRLLRPTQFMNWMSERPLSPKEEPKITKEEPKYNWHPTWNQTDWSKDMRPFNK